MIQGKVARIPNDEEVVLNIGRQHGVKEDMEFVIYQESDHIVDPETHEDLGAIELVKGRVKVFHIMDRMSRARTILVEDYSPQTFAAARMLYGGERTFRRTKLTVAEGQISPLLEDRAVRVGDLVRSV
jgi:hypothetical protein